MSVPVAQRLLSDLLAVIHRHYGCDYADQWAMWQASLRDPDEARRARQALPR